MHFGGHVVAMYGYDEQDAYLVDTDPQGGAVSTSLAGLARARAERGPMTAKHRSFTITAPSSPTPALGVCPALPQPPCRKGRFQMLSTADFPNSLSGKGSRLILE